MDDQIRKLFEHCSIDELLTNRQFHASHCKYDEVAVIQQLLEERVNGVPLPEVANDGTVAPLVVPKRDSAPHRLVRGAAKAPFSLGPQIPN